ncbi:MAG: hypothetical protein R2796_07590 [Chitinophagaceae bacterium]|nr:hypothetical protein [Chitinophagaceae bacterium]
MKNRIISKVLNIVSLIFLTSIVACKSKNKIKYDEFYWKFHHTIQKVDTVTEKIEFISSNREVTKQEIDTLLIILNKWGWEHHLSGDSILFIRKYGDDVMNNMRALDDELYRRTKDTVNRTRRE